MHSVLMVAAENGTFPGGKVGGIGDVIREVSPALAKAGCAVQVVTPSFADVVARARGASQVELSVPFRQKMERLLLVEISAERSAAGVRHWVLDHPLFTVTGRIYNDDPPDRPFATDASKFALFCAGVGAAILEGRFGRLDVLHLHDWHAAWLLVLRRFARRFRSLQSIRTVYTIHNLALQGVRPFAGHWSSLDAWFPDLEVDRSVLRDPRWPDCVNPTATAIRLAEAVHTVSPSYAREILRPSAIEERGYYGGEGLEADLRDAADQGRLHGILNGCEYSAVAAGTIERSTLLAMADAELLIWVAARATVASTHLVAQKRLGEWSTRSKPEVLITSVSRITGQKVGLLQQTLKDGTSTLEALLKSLGDRGLYVFLGTGAPELESFLTKTSALHSNFLFLNGYSERLANAMYASGDLFLMPSSYEPCGISQMLAMRSGQPCLVHGVGGLRDTVSNEVNGFVFEGENPQEQAANLLAKFDRAMSTRRYDPEFWKRLSRAAKAARFRWEESVAQYCSQLYRPAP